MSKGSDYAYEGFSYDGDKLASFRSKDLEHKFYYENDVLIKSEYFKNGTRYTQRFYHYNEQGLITKTEIFNTFNEPEYTIIYDYEYFES